MMLTSVVWNEETIEMEEEDMMLCPEIQNDKSRCVSKGMFLLNLSAP